MEMLCFNGHYNVLKDLWVNMVSVSILQQLDLKYKNKSGTIIKIRH